MAKRIQLKRTKGWKMPEGAIYVGRGSKWGNPFKLERGQTREEVIVRWPPKTGPVAKLHMTEKKHLESG